MNTNERELSDEQIKEEVEKYMATNEGVQQLRRERMARFESFIEMLGDLHKDRSEYPIAVIVNFPKTKEDQAKLLREVEEKQPGAVKFIFGPLGKLLDIRK